MAGETKGRHDRLALLIDADNVRGDFVPIIMREASALGTVSVKRVYGHFASSSMNTWHPLVHEHALSPVHIPPAVHGKNATEASDRGDGSPAPRPCRGLLHRLL